MQPQPASTTRRLATTNKISRGLVNAKKKALFSFAAFALLLLPAAPSLRADLLYDNGPDNQNTSKMDTINSAHQVSDDFTLSASSVLTSVVFAEETLLGGLCGGVPCTATPVPASVDWCIATAAFGTNVACGSAGVTATPTGFTSGSLTDYSSAFSLPNLSLAAGKYFLTLGNAANTDGSQNDYWGTTGSATSGDALLSPGFIGPGPGNLNNDASFQIFGTVSGSTAVPEPSFRAVLAAGLLALLFRSRRRLLSRKAAR